MSIYKNTKIIYKMSIKRAYCFEMAEVQRFELWRAGAQPVFKTGAIDR